MAMNYVENDHILVTGTLGWLGISLVEALVKGSPGQGSIMALGRRNAFDFLRRTRTWISDRICP